MSIHEDGPLTGTPDAGNPSVRCGGRGGCRFGILSYPDPDPAGETPAPQRGLTPAARLTKFPQRENTNAPQRIQLPQPERGDAKPATKIANTDQTATPLRNFFHPARPHAHRIICSIPYPPPASVNPILKYLQLFLSFRN